MIWCGMAGLATEQERKDRISIQVVLSQSCCATFHNPAILSQSYFAAFHNPAILSQSYFAAFHSPAILSQS